jgi:hypothetical protein
VHVNDEPVEEPPGRWSRGWAWFAGADPRVLAHAPGERSFTEALGMVVAALAVASGFTLSVAASNWWNVPISHVLWVGAAWWVVIVLVERLVLKSFGTRRRWYPLLILPRVALTLAIALVFGVPMVQLVFKPSIENQLSITATQQKREATTAAGDFYGPRIKAARQEIAAIGQHEETLTRQVAHFDLLRGCEANEPSCSYTHKTGCGNWCRYYERKAQAARAELAAARPEDRRTVAKLQADIGRWQAAEQAEIASRHRAIDGNVDMLARQEALTAVERAHPEVSKYVLFVLLLFVFLDLVPLTMKVFHLLSSGGAYEEVAAAYRELDRSEAARLHQHAIVRRSQVEERARAELDVAAVEIGLERARRLAEAQERLDGFSGGALPPQPAPRSA